MERPLALVVDRDPTTRELIRGAFESHEIVVRGAGSAAEATKTLGTLPVRIVVVDVDTPGVDVIRLLRDLSHLPRPPVVLALARDDDPSRDAALIDAGALDVVSGSLDAERARLVARKAVRHEAMLVELGELRRGLQSREGYHGIVGRSRSTERLRERIARLAESDGAVWLCGEPGTGKELAARTIHAGSGRAAGRFQLVACANLSAADWEGGAAAPLAASAGDLLGATLYLEDVPALSTDLQSRLAASLEGLSTPAGDVRLMASSVEEPAALVARGRLIEPLAARLAVEVVKLAPLRERVEDIPLLARHFVSTICSINKLPPIQLVPEAMDVLEGHRWPDNVQGLRNALEHAVILSPDGKIRPRDLPDRLREAAAATDAPAAGHGASGRAFRDAKREVVEAFERSYLGGLMERHNGNVTAAAQQAGMLRSALQRLLRKYGLKSAAFRRDRRRAKVEDTSRPER